MPGEPKRVQPSRDTRPAALTTRLRQLLRAALRDRRARRRHDRADVAVGRLVEVDDDRRVVARALALAGLAVDPGGLDALGDRVAGQHEVDPHPEVLVEHAGAVVPVGEDALAGPAVAHDVVEAGGLQLGQRRALARR